MRRSWPTCQAEEKDLVETTDILERAIAIMEKAGVRHMYMPEYWVQLHNASVCGYIDWSITVPEMIEFNL